VLLWALCDAPLLIFHFHFAYHRVVILLLTVNHAGL